MDRERAVALDPGGRRPSEGYIAALKACQDVVLQKRES